MKDYITQLKPVIFNLFEQLHTHPEISFKEYKTTAYLASFLQQKGFEVKTFPDCTGLIAEIGEGRLCVALRSDMDALWQQVDGTEKANHSCGHDAHMTMTAGAMLLLQKLGFPMGVRFKFIFQPGEEKGQGALKLIEKGIVDDVDYLYGVHLRPIQELSDGEASPSIYHGAVRSIEGEILGEDAHAGRPHLGQNAIEIGAMLIHQIQSIHLDPMIPYSAKVTKFISGGDSSNIIPGKASFSIDLRAQRNETIEELFQKIRSAADSLADLNDVQIKLQVKADTAAARVGPLAKKAMRQAIEETVGEERLIDPLVTSGGEDFHFYTLKRPNIQASMLGLGCGLTPGLHHPEMSFNKEAMLTGIEILVKTMLYTIKANDPG